MTASTARSAPLWEPISGGSVAVAALQVSHGSVAGLEHSEGVVLATSGASCCEGRRGPVRSHHRLRLFLLMWRGPLVPAKHCECERCEAGQRGKITATRQLLFRIAHGEPGAWRAYCTPYVLCPRIEGKCPTAVASALRSFLRWWCTHHWAGCCEPWGVLKSSR